MKLTTRRKVAPVKGKMKKDAYHHGNLREALLESALGLIKEAGLESLTLREVARRAGVSPGAPYHHFKDKSELVQALAQRSLETLDHISREAIQNKATPTEKLHALGVAYIMYAVEHPAEFRIMFRPELSLLPVVPDPATAPVFGVLIEVIREFPTIKEAQQLTVTIEAAITAWSLVHGLAVLLLDGPLQRIVTDKRDIETLAKEVVARVTF
jgi:AcrR family transcriptional regulator